MKSVQHRLVLGDENVYLLVSEWGDPAIVYINLHENEQTSVLAAREVLSNGHSVLIELKSKGDRLVSFYHNSIKHSFDPNRIFSSIGIKNTLNENGTYDFSVEYRLANFADSILNKIMSYNPSLVVALHNTTGEYSVDSYMKGGQFENDCSELFINLEKNKSDLFFTNDRSIFNKVRAGNFNVVLQDNENATNDGSLSVYCAEKGLKYINVETLHGNLSEQKIMIEFIRINFSSE